MGVYLSCFRILMDLKSEMQIPLRSHISRLRNNLQSITIDVSTYVAREGLEATGYAYFAQIMARASRCLDTFIIKFPKIVEGAIERSEQYPGVEPPIPECFMRDGEICSLPTPGCLNSCLFTHVIVSQLLNLSKRSNY